METLLTPNNACVRKLLVFLFVLSLSKSMLACYIGKTDVTVLNDAPYEW